VTAPVNLAEIVQTAKDVLWPSGLFLSIALWGYGVVPKPDTHLRVQVKTPGKKRPYLKASTCSNMQSKGTAVSGSRPEKICSKDLKMRENLKARITSKIITRRPGQSRTFCGTTGNIVDCGPKECHQLEGICRQKLGEVVAKHRPILRLLRDNIQKKSERTGISSRDLAMQDYGDLVGLLVGLVDDGKETARHA